MSSGIIINFFGVDILDFNESILCFNSALKTRCYAPSVTCFHGSFFPFFWLGILFCILFVAPLPYQLEPNPSGGINMVVFFMQMFIVVVLFAGFSAGHPFRRPRCSTFGIQTTTAGPPLSLILYVINHATQCWHDSTRILFYSLNAYMQPEQLQDSHLNEFSFWLRCAVESPKLTNSVSKKNEHSDILFSLTSKKCFLGLMGV